MNKIYNNITKGNYLIRNLITKSSNNNNSNIRPIKYTSNHQWVRLSENNQNVTIGITKYVSNIAINEQNKILDIKLPKVNDSIKINQPLLSIFTKEDNIQFNSPLSGTILKVNNHILGSNGTIPPNEDHIWTVELKTNDPNELSSIFNYNLMSQNEYIHYSEDVDYK